MNVTVLSIRDRVVQSPGTTVLNVTSRSTNVIGRALSPFVLGPIKLYDGYVAQNVENAWQFSKVYPEHDFMGAPNEAYWKWAQEGWSSRYAHRYPMGKGVKPRYSWWDGQPLTYVQARRMVYIPLYSQAVLDVGPAWEALKDMARRGPLVLLDFDAYDRRAIGYGWEDVVDDPKRKMGHAFVLAMMLEGVDLKEICK